MLKKLLNISRIGKLDSIRLVGIIIITFSILTAVIGYLNEYHDLNLGNVGNRIINEYYSNLSTELLSISITILIIDAIYRKRDDEQSKADLVLQLGSPENSFTVEAARILRKRGWLSGKTLWNADLSLSNLNGVDLEFADLRGADLSHASMIETDFCDANLQGAQLGNTEMTSALLTRANLQDTILAESGLQKAGMRDANLSNSVLSGSDLTGAQMQNAVLVNAKLPYAKLCNAQLQNANLQGALLKYTNLDGANLENANLRNAKIIAVQLNKAKSLTGTTMPDGRKYEEWLDDEEKIIQENTKQLDNGEESTIEDNGSVVILGVLLSTLLIIFGKVISTFLNKRKTGLQ